MIVKKTYPLGYMHGAVKQVYYVSFTPKDEVYICKFGEKELYLGTNNFDDCQLRRILPKIKGAKLVKREIKTAYKDDPYGNLVACGSIDCQTWDISEMYNY